MRTTTVVITGGAVGIFALPTFADVLYDNGPVNGVNGYSNATSGVFGFRRSLLDDFVVPDGGWTLQHWLPAAMSQYASLLRKAKAAAQSWGDNDTFVSLEEQDSIRGQIFESAQVEQWAINAEVHYNDWTNLSGAEFRTAVEAFGDLYGLFECSQCGGLLALTYDGHIPAAVRCPCAKVSWNLQARPGRGP